MKLKEALTYYDDEYNNEFFYEYYNYNDVVDFIAEEIEEFWSFYEDDYPGMTSEEVIEEMADGKFDLPNRVAKEIRNYYAEYAYKWNAERYELDDLDPIMDF